MPTKIILQLLNYKTKQKKKKPKITLNRLVFKSTKITELTTLNKITAALTLNFLPKSLKPKINTLTRISVLEEI